MGRGGGSASKHSTSGGGGGGSVSVGKGNPIVSGICYGIAAVVFFVLTIAVPVYLVVSPPGDLCTPAKSLNKGEQMTCTLKNKDDLDETWIAEASSSKIKIYKDLASKFASASTTTRVVRYTYSTTLNEEYDDFTLSAPLGVSGYIDISVTRDTYVYLLSDSTFKSCFDANGVFIRDYCTKYENKVSKDSGHGAFDLTSSGYSHLVVACFKDKDDHISYTLDLTYKVYVLDGFTPKSGTKVEFEDMTLNDMIVMDFADTQSKTDSYDASIHNDDINWSAVFACAAIFALLTIICIILAVFYLFKILKKIGKIGKKVAKKVEKEHEKQAAAEAAAAQDQPAVVVQPADPNYGQPYGQQPYPGQM